MCRDLQIMNARGRRLPQQTSYFTRTWRRDPTRTLPPSTTTTTGADTRRHRPDQQEASNLEREREREWRNETETMSTPRARPNCEMISFSGNHPFHLIDAFDLYVPTNRDLVQIKLSLLNRRDRRYAFRPRPTRLLLVCSRSLLVHRTLLTSHIATNSPCRIPTIT